MKTQNLIYSITNNIGIMVLPFLVIPHLTRVLGPEELGKISFALSIFSIFNATSSLGLNLFGKKRVAQYSSSISKRNIIFTSVILSKCLMTILTSITYTIVIFILFPDDKLIFLVLLIDNFINIVDVSFAYHGLLKFRIILLVTLIPKIISTALILTFVVNEGMGHVYLIILSSVSFAGYALFLIHQRSFRLVRFRLIQLAYLRQSIEYFIMNLMQTIEQSYDRFIVGYVALQYSQLGFYDIALKIVILFSSLVVSVSNVIMPMLARGKHVSEEIRTYSLRLFLIIIVTATAFSILMKGVLPKYLVIIFGEKYSGAEKYCVIFSVLVITKSVSIFIQQTFLIAQNKIKKANKISFVAVGVAIPLYSYLSFFHGIMTVAFAVCLIEFLKANAFIFISNTQNNVQIMLTFWLAVALLMSVEYPLDTFFLSGGLQGLLLQESVLLGIVFLLFVRRTFRNLR